MCTLTILPGIKSGSISRGVRIAFNRDEQRSRTSGTNPSLERHEDWQALLPRDPQGGGTWIAASDRGLVFTLLNVNPAESDPTSSGGASRGSIIPGLLSSASLDEVAARLPALSAPIRRPFRLVVTDGASLLEAIGGNALVECLRHPLDQPFMRCSSGLGDEVVAPLRTEAFSRLFTREGADPVAAQEAFHRLRFSDREDCSIDMSREDALTVSWTLVELRPGVLRMTHHPGPPREQPTPVVLELGLRHPAPSSTGVVVE